MNILIPIAGRDRYFPEGQFVFPKPLVDICGTPLIEHTLQAFLNLQGDPRFTFVVQEQDCKSYSLDDVLKVVVGPKKTQIVQIGAPTQGAICSCLLAIDHIDPDEELLIANGDQVLLGSIAAALDDFRRRELDAGVITFPSTHPRFSYVRVDADGSDHRGGRKARHQPTGHRRALLFPPRRRFHRSGQTRAPEQQPGAGRVLHLAGPQRNDP